MHDAIQIEPWWHIKFTALSIRQYTVDSGHRRLKNKGGNFGVGGLSVPRMRTLSVTCHVT